MPTIHDLARFAQLMQAAYANFTTFDDQGVRTALRDPDGGGFSVRQAADLTDGFAVLDHLSNDVYGFSATLLQSKTNPNEIIFSIRGTEPGVDFTQADADIALHGLARHQIVSLYNYYQRLIAPEGGSVIQYLPAPGVPNDADDVFLYEKQTVAGVGLGKLSPTTQLTVTGHSLGGHLAIAFARMFSNQASSVYTYNAPGFAFTGTLNTLMDRLVGPGSSFPTDNITNVNAYNGPEVTSGFLTLPGSPQLDVFIEDQGVIRLDVGNHSSLLLTDTLALYDVFAKLDPNVQIPTLNQIMEAASAPRGHSLEDALDSLRKIFSGTGIERTPISSPLDENGTSPARDTYYTNLLALRDSIPTGGHQLISFVGQGPEVLVPQAQRQDAPGIAYRYALKELNPFVVLGADYSLHNESGELALVNLDTGVGELTTQYLTDRAAFLAKKIEVNSSLVPDAVSLASATHFKDTQSGEEIGSSILPLPQVIFGDDSNESITGSLFFADSLYGGSGDDRLFGQGSKDYLEGNQDNDTLDGGSGVDRLVGGAGDDVYIVDDARDQVIEAVGGGTDRILSASASFVLPEFVEKLTVVAGGVLGRGNELANELATETKQGILVGGQGDDTYLLNAPGTVVEAAGQGTDTVQSTVSVTLGGHVEHLVLTGNSAIDGTGNDQDNVLTGNSASNTLFGGGGQDHLIGGAGNDILSGGVGTDLLEGGGGNDLYIYNSGDGVDRIEDTEGTNFILYDGRVLQGGIKKTGETQYTSLDGRFTYTFSGGDLLVNGTLILNQDFQSGQFGIRLVDEVNYDNGLDTRSNGDFTRPAPNPNPPPAEIQVPVFDEGDNSAVISGGTNLIIDAMGGHDAVFTEGVGNDQLFGGAGNDTLLGSGGHDRLYGGEGNDTLTGDAGDSLQYTPGRDTLDGGAGDDSLVGNQSDDVLLGGTGDDHLFGDGGNTPDWDASQDGQDLVDGGAGQDIAYGGGGDDVLAGGDGNDTLWGDYGVLGLDAISGNDTLDGGAGDDGLVGGGGADVLFGGAGSDLLFGDSPLAGSTAAGGNDILDGGEGVDDLIGQGGDDVLFGGSGDDALWGGSQGDPLMVDTTGSDFLDGGAGNDLLSGEEGNDTLLGGDGNDRLYGTRSDAPSQNDADVLDGGAGNDDLQGGGGDDVLIGGSGDDRLLGDDTTTGAILVASTVSGSDELDGGDGNDLMSGNGGNDTLRGGGGQDVLFGDDWMLQSFAPGFIDNPFVNGMPIFQSSNAAGDDTLDGGAGNDLLEGGAGNDLSSARGRIHGVRGPAGGHGPSKGSAEARQHLTRIAVPIETPRIATGILEPLQRFSFQRLLDAH